MSSLAALQPEPAPILACTISRDVSNFDLLIEDMETELGESWGDLTFSDAMLFLNQPDAQSLVDRPNKSHNFDLLAPFLPSFSGSFETEELGRSLTISVDLEGTGTTARHKGKRLASGERSRVKKDVRE